MIENKTYKCSRPLEQQILRWSLTEETGTSSKYMAGVAAFGCNFEGRKSFIPGDLYDFVRCERLVASCPSFSEAFDELRKVSSAWREFIDRWDELKALLGDRTAADSYADYERMRTQILTAAYYE